MKLQDISPARPPPDDIEVAIVHVMVAKLVAELEAKRREREALRPRFAARPMAMHFTREQLDLAYAQAKARNPRSRPDPNAS